MALRLNGQTSGYVELEAPATAGSNTLTLPNGGGSSGQYLQTDGSGGLSWQTVTTPSEWVYGSAQSVGTGTSHTVSGLATHNPTKVVVIYENLSGTAADYLYFRFGPSTGVETSGYAWANNGNDNNTVYTSSTNMWFVNVSGAAYLHDIQFHYTRINGNKWSVFAFANGRDSSGVVVGIFTIGSGTLDLSGTFDRVEAYPGSGNFDSGEVTVHYLPE